MAYQDDFEEWWKWHFEPKIHTNNDKEEARCGWDAATLRLMEDNHNMMQEIQALKEALEKAEKELSILKPILDKAADFNLHELVLQNDDLSEQVFVLKEKLSVAQSKLGEKTELEDVGELMQHRTRLITVASQALEALQTCCEYYNNDTDSDEMFYDKKIIKEAIEALKKELGHE